MIFHLLLFKEEVEARVVADAGGRSQVVPGTLAVRIISELTGSVEYRALRGPCGIEGNRWSRAHSLTHALGVRTVQSDRAPLVPYRWIVVFTCPGVRGT